MHDPLFLCTYLTPKPAPSLGAKINHRVDGRQRNQTGEAKGLNGSSWELVGFFSGQLV